MAYRRAFVATDLSDGAAVALQQARAIAAPDAAIAIGHAYAAAPPAVYGMPDAFDREQARKMLEQALADWAAQTGAPDAERFVRIGRAAHELTAAAREWRADLAAVGATGRSRVSAILLGTTARAVLREMPIDTLVARGDDNAPLRSILVATDFHEPSEAAAARAHELAERAGAQLTLAHVLEYDMLTWPLHELPAVTPNIDLAAMERAAAAALARLNAEKLGGRATLAQRKGRAHREIVALAEETQADLVVVGTRGAGRVERALLGSVAERVAEAAPCSVLVVRG